MKRSRQSLRHCYLVCYHRSPYCGAQSAFWGHALLDCWELSPGLAWWFHRTEPNLPFGFDVYRRNWLRVRIAQIDGSGLLALLRGRLSLWTRTTRTSLRSSPSPGARCVALRFGTLGGELLQQGHSCGRQEQRGLGAAPHCASGIRRPSLPLRQVHVRRWYGPDRRSDHIEDESDDGDVCL